MRNIVIFGSNILGDLATKICKRLSLAPGQIQLAKFKNGETQVMIQDSVRECDVYVVCKCEERVNDELMELLVTISACKTASAAKVTAILPIFPYSKQTELQTINLQTQLTGDSSNKVIYTDVDESEESQTSTMTDSTSASNLLLWPESDNNRNDSTVQIAENSSFCGCLVADLLVCAGANHVITMDLHEPQFQGFFDIPVDNLYARPLFQKYIMISVKNYKDSVIVTPDAGGAKRASAIADSLGLAFALIHREKVSNRKENTIPNEHNVNSDLVLVGDVNDKIAIIIDDMIDTGVTITDAANKVRACGASQILALATHGILSGNAIDLVNKSSLDKLVVTNTIPQQEHIKKSSKIEVLDVAPIFAEAIRRIHYGESVSMLFEL